MNRSAPLSDSLLSPIRFLQCSWVALGLLFLIGGGVWYLVLPRLNESLPIIKISVKSLLLAASAILFSGLLLISASVLLGRDFLFPHIRHQLTIPVLYPLAFFVGKVVRIGKDELRSSYVGLNNTLNLVQRRRISVQRILVLLPHCLQIDTCNRKVAGNTQNCTRCGHCPVGRLLELGDRYGIRIEVANGGTSARRSIVEFRPQGIVAVACERDLSAGIQDAYPVPVFGVLNDRPHGHCLNTTVDIREVEEGVRFFLGNKAGAEPDPLNTKGVQRSVHR